MGQERFLRSDFQRLTFWEGMGKGGGEYIGEEITGKIGTICAKWETRKRGLHDELGYLI